MRPPDLQHFEAPERCNAYKHVDRDVKVRIGTSKVGEGQTKRRTPIVTVSHVIADLYVVD